MSGKDPSKYITQFCDMLRFEKNASDHTIRAYENDLQEFSDWLGHSKIAIFSATKQHLRAYLLHMQESGFVQSSINRHISSLRTFYTWAYGQGLCIANPAAALNTNKKRDHLPRVLSLDELNALFAIWAPNGKPITPEGMRNYAILEFMYASGCRVSEVAALKASNVNLNEGSAKVIGKGNKERVVLLYPKAVCAMKQYLCDARAKLLQRATRANTHSAANVADQSNTQLAAHSTAKLPAHDAFFISNTGRNMSADTVRKMFSDTVRAAGLSADITPHTFRHTFATHLLEGKADLRTVQELLGHKSLSSTQIYTHLDSKHLLDVYSAAHPRGGVGGAP